MVIHAANITGLVGTRYMFDLKSAINTVSVSLILFVAMFLCEIEILGRGNALQATNSQSK